MHHTLSLGSDSLALDTKNSLFFQHFILKIQTILSETAPIMYTSWARHERPSREAAAYGAGHAGLFRCQEQLLKGKLCSAVE